MTISGRWQGFALCLLVWVSKLTAGEAVPELGALPEPLTLEFALSLADAPHPDLMLAAAEQDLALAQRQREQSATGLYANFTAKALWIEPSDAARDQSHNDSQAALMLQKRLYDFGHTRASLASADALIASRRMQYADLRSQRGLAILQRYLDVLLADLAFRVQDEAMAIAYVQLDRTRDRQELGQLSDIDRLELESRYQEVRSARIAAQAAQRTSRVRLAEALHRPGQLPSRLTQPALQWLDTPLPPADSLLQEVFEHNPGWQALQAQREAAQARLQAARTVDRPVLSGVAEASEYQRNTGSRDPWAVGLQLDVPLYSGGRAAADRAQARAELRKQEALLAAAEAELRETVQLLWEEIQVLQASRSESQARVDFRELYLDRSRALYEMEVRTDLGDAMVLSTQARLREAELDYRLLLNRARLNGLRGRPLLGDRDQAVGIGNQGGEVVKPEAVEGN